MAAPAKPRSIFGEQLRSQLERHQTIKSVRRLSQVIAPERAEHMRRMLQKWIAGPTKPTITSRFLVATALEVDASVFAADGDDDEEEAELGELVRALLHQVSVVVDRKLDERLRTHA